MPYFGQPVLPSFGRGQHGLDGVTLSYLAISGTSDTTAPIAQTLEGVARLAGPRELVALTGVKHGFDVASTDDIFTWSVTYLDAEVRGDPVARAKLARMTSVAGGGRRPRAHSLQRIRAGRIRIVQLGRPVVERSRRLGVGLGHQSSRIRAM